MNYFITITYIQHKNDIKYILMDCSIRFTYESYNYYVFDSGSEF